MKLKPAYRFHLALLLVISLLACALMPVSTAIASMASVHHHTSESEERGASMAATEVVMVGAMTHHGMSAEGSTGAHDKVCEGMTFPLTVPFFTFLFSSFVAVLLVSCLQLASVPCYLRRYSTSALFPSRLRSHLTVGRIHV